MGQLTVTPDTVAIGQDVTVQGVPTPGFQMSPSSGYFEKDGQTLFGFTLAPMADGSLSGTFSTFDWEPGSYTARIVDFRVHKEITGWEIQ